MGAKQILKEGTLLQGGKYRILRFIGSGGFGCTYEAIHILLNRKIAIKEFFVEDFCARDGATSLVTVTNENKRPLVNKLRHKFIDEACALNEMSHEGIVKVTDVFEENGTAYYVMDYIKGHSLADIIKNEGPLTEQRALKYIRQVCNALKYVHARNRLHLDIKPGNIMIDGSDRAILIDFGTSKQYDEENGENTSTLIGFTPGYAPLEQMGKNVVKFHEATDIYAVGATLYKMLTGVTPPSSNLLASEQEELKPLPDNISSSTRNVVNAAMQLSKKKRPQSIQELLKMFDEATVIDNPKPKPTPSPQPVPIIIDPRLESEPELESEPQIEETDPQIEEEEEDGWTTNKKAMVMIAILAVGALVWYMMSVPRETAPVPSLSIEDTVEVPEYVDLSVFAGRGEGQQEEEYTTEEKTENVNGEEIASSKVTTEKVFDVVEKMPSFPDGNKALTSWLSSNLQYPVIAAENGVQGRVIVQFVVEKNGSISNVQVVKSVDPVLDKEAVRVVSNMPNWIPGKQNGVAVRVRYTIPIVFRIM